MNAKDFRNVILFLCNKWSKDEANLIFNTNGSKFDYEKWEYSLGEHIWNKWVYGCEIHHGSLDCIAWFLTELDNENLQKLIDRSIEYYNK